MKNLLIVGARGMGRDTYGFMTDFIGYNETYTVKGFLDSDEHALDGFNGYPPILSSVEEYEIQKDDVFVVALGSPAFKQKYVEILRMKGAEFISLISKRSFINVHNHGIGTGCIIFGNFTISSDVTIGSHVTFLCNVTIGHDSIIEDYSVLDCDVFCGGYSHIKKGVLIGTGSKILPHVTVGEKATVNAGSIVPKNVPDNAKVMGSPAQDSKSWLRMIFQNTKR